MASLPSGPRPAAAAAAAFLAAALLAASASNSAASPVEYGALPCNDGNWTDALWSDLHYLPEPGGTAPADKAVVIPCGTRVTADVGGGMTVAFPEGLEVRPPARASLLTNFGACRARV